MCFRNCGTPKSSILIGIPIINYPFWGTPIFGNTHIHQYHSFRFRLLVHFVASRSAVCPFFSTAQRIAEAAGTSKESSTKRSFCLQFSRRFLNFCIHLPAGYCLRMCTNHLLEIFFASEKDEIKKGTNIKVPTIHFQEGSKKWSLEHLKISRFLSGLSQPQGDFQRAQQLLRHWGAAKPWRALLLNPLLEWLPRSIWQVWYGWWKKSGDSPVDVVNIPLFTRFLHHPRWCRTSSINSSSSKLSGD